MVSVRTVGSAAVVKVAGDVDVTDVVTLRNTIAQLVEDTIAAQVVVDVTDAHHLGPRGLATLVDEKALLMRRGGDLRLVMASCCARAGTCPSGPEAASLGRLFHVFETVEEALAQIPGAAAA